MLLPDITEIIRADGGNVYRDKQSGDVVYAGRPLNHILPDFYDQFQEWTTCPECNCELKARNLFHHLDTVHGTIARQLPDGSIRLYTLEERKEMFKMARSGQLHQLEQTSEDDITSKGGRLPGSFESPS